METIKKDKEFNFFYNHAKKIFTKYVLIFHTKTKEQKFGFVTSKKVGNAVKRNRLRRIFREVVHKNIEKFDKNSSYIIIAKKTCLEDYENIKYEDIKKDILRGLQKNVKNITGKID